MEKLLKVYADGGNRNTGVQKGGHVNPNDPSAWAFLIESTDGLFRFEDTKLEIGKTNNAMEVSAVGYALNLIINNPDLNDYDIELVLDSKYVLDSLEKGWAANWIKKNDTARPNFELWKNLLPMYEILKPRITFTWVKGHDKTKGNIYVDELLNKTMDKA